MDRTVCERRTDSGRWEMHGWDVTARRCLPLISEQTGRLPALGVTALNCLLQRHNHRLGPAVRRPALMGGAWPPRSRRLQHCLMAASFSTACDTVLCHTRTCCAVCHCNDRGRPRTRRGRGQQQPCLARTTASRDTAASSRQPAHGYSQLGGHVEATYACMAPCMQPPFSPHTELNP